MGEPHEGHRSRLTGKIRRGDSLYAHELLEVLLFNACPRRDLNATAHALLSRFNKIDKLLSAPASEIEKVDGVGRNMAEYIECLGKTLSRCNDCKSFTVLKCTADFKQYISVKRSPSEDILELCFLDGEGRVRRVRTFKAGGKGEIKEGEVLKLLSVHQPYGLFAVCRRASGNANPTEWDDAFVRSLDGVARFCGCKLYDYCISSEDGGFYSYFVADRASFASLAGAGGGL